MIRVTCPAIVVVLLAALLGGQPLSAAEKVLREVPPVDQVKSITASWYDAGYRSFVRGWTVPRESWPAVLEATRAVRKKAEETAQESPVAFQRQVNHYVHLRFTTRDGRSLLIVSSDNGDLRGFPYKGCKDPFVFAEAASPQLRSRLGQIYRAAQGAAD